MFIKNPGFILKTRIFCFNAVLCEISEKPHILCLTMPIIITGMSTAKSMIKFTYTMISSESMRNSREFGAIVTAQAMATAAQASVTSTRGEMRALPARLFIPRESRISPEADMSAKAQSTKSDSTQSVVTRASIL